MNHVRHRLIRETASKLIQTARINDPPVDLHKIADLYASSIIYHDRPSFSYTVKYRGLYFICLHRSGNAYRDRWSLAHEIGHIALNHFACLEAEVLFSMKDSEPEDAGIQVQSDSARLSDEQRFVLEQEADLFAEEILLPRNLLQPYIVQNHSSDEISGLFMVSKEATQVLIGKLGNL